MAHLDYRPYLYADNRQKGQMLLWNKVLCSGLQLNSVCGFVSGCSNRLISKLNVIRNLTAIPYICLYTVLISTIEWCRLYS